jgi:hypothetical protein
LNFLYFFHNKNQYICRYIIQTKTASDEKIGSHNTDTFYSLSLESSIELGKTLL